MTVFAQPGSSSRYAAAWLLTVLAFNLVGEGLQKSTDPRLREARK